MTATDRSGPTGSALTTAPLVLSLSDGCGIRLMLRDPTATLDAALAPIWRHVAAALGLPEALPVE
ncbi:hypothetical protein [Streptomyces tropicalis]|uniref:Uncharacterized protein n=1 Tax=Streptomyces tropicalis TaxID=3034234 RepID=A0ABT6A9M9_9ACTN|nr:hypothetical protein [Streptomyces tropicalis]MDF3301361.1 hypothetical protein [Streptomyces tropicalis]